MLLAMQTAPNSTIETHGRAVRTLVNDRRKSLKATAWRSCESAGMKLSLAIQIVTVERLDLEKWKSMSRRREAARQFGFGHGAMTRKICRCGALRDRSITRKLARRRSRALD